MSNYGIDPNYEKVARCNYWKELHSLLDEIGIVIGSREKAYSPEDIKEKIRQLKKGFPLQVMTRTYGLRAKCAELLYYGENHE